MQPPISSGTVLQSRYCLLRMLGQGGFGRTYLAEDLGRFNECCALKEFIPVQTGEYALEKSRELFQREAAILYQIQHPQVPQFRATFQEGDRLFLVQDYVEGKTYRDLLNERKAAGQTFAEPEVLQLVRQLLPVLAHLHSKSIIHRDIAPDNIILRQQDNLPVLIDFGVVKEIVTRFQGPGTVSQYTTVGKLGFAPSEQMQTGRAYPSSDLYSLAATAVVLLTGHEPQEMYDDINLVWNWQRYASVSPEFAQILNKMLNYRPGDRYQSVREVVQAIQTGINSATTSAATPATPPPIAPMNPGNLGTSGNDPASFPAPPLAPPVSQMKTLAVGRRSDPHGVQPPPRPPAARRPDPVIPQSSDPSVWDNPWAILGLVLGMAVVTGIGSFAVVSALRNTSSPTPPPVESPSPTPTVAPSPTPTPTPAEPVEYTQQLDLQPGETTTTEGNLRSNETVTYIITGEPEETLTVSLEDEGVLLTVLGPDQTLINDAAERVRRWQGDLPEAGNYYIQVSPVRNVEESDYRLTLSLEAAPEPEPTPTPTPEPPPPTPEPSPTPPRVQSERVQFPPGLSSILVAKRAAPNLIWRYLVRAEAGQIMTVEVVQGDVRLDLNYPDGTPIADASGLRYWEAQLPESGDYQIDVIADDAVEFTLRISVTDAEF
jgi:serine/threonine-protein kinase